ncbi:MAG: molybdopterin-dependent oxidoreductase [Coriobacteriales bacterium]|nr:molybdopterin-dependent oxidoreductase [Coriobacteriales bacterium]
MQERDKMDLTRRTFVATGASAAVTAAMAASLTATTAALSGCSPETKPQAADSAQKTIFRLDPELDPNIDGKWVPVACWHNCGGRCANYAFVSNGKVLRQKTDDFKDDSWESPQQRSCLRGRSQQWQTFAEDRLLYPIKRKGWSPDAPNGQMRGKDQWERISWDDALDYIAAELIKAKERYGNSSIFCPANSNITIGSALAAFGGYTNYTDSASFGCFNDNMAVIGLPLMGLGNAYDRLAMQKSEYIVLYGCNPAWASGGNQTWYFYQAKEAGAQFIFVGPEYNVSASLLDARWIRVRPGTDTAFLLAVAYEMLKAEEAAPGSVVDQDFLNKYCVGFDSEHMPDDATTTENFKDYVLGALDQMPKTAEWASEITGTPVEDIRWYAQIMSKQNKVGILHSFAAARCHNSESLPQLFYGIGAMGGHFGGEGNTVGSAYHTQAGNNGFPLILPGGNQNKETPNIQGADTLRAPEVWDAILNNKYNYTGDFSMRQGTHMPSEERSIDIHIIYNEHTNYLQTFPGINKGIEAYRKVDFVVTQGHFFNTVAKYSDIVLPVTTLWEREDASVMTQMSGREFAYYPQKAIEPQGETKDDIQISRLLATRLGLDVDAIYPFTGKQAKYNTLASSLTFISKDGMGPLFTISQEEIDSLGASGKPQDGMMPLSVIAQSGYAQIPRSEGDHLSVSGWDAFLADPDAKPLASKSGRFEFYCEEWAKIVNQQGRSTIKPYPTYIRPMDGYEDSFSDWENKTKGEYPFQITNPHYLRRSHTVFNNIGWLREAYPNPVFINSDDAKAKGIAQGDTVLVSSKYGAILRQASLTERLMPGVLALPHGSWVDIDEKTGIDKGGCDNSLVGPVCTGAGISGYNTTLVNVEKYTGPNLQPDYLWQPQMPQMA